MKSKSFIQSKKQKKKPQTKLTLNNKIKSGFFVLFLIPLFTMQPFFPTNKQFSPALPAALPSLCGTVWSYNTSTVRWAAVSRSSSSHSWSRSHSGFSSRRVTWPTRTAARGGKKKTWTEKQRKRGRESWRLPPTQVVEVFGHEADADVQEDLLDAWSGERGLEEGH